VDGSGVAMRPDPIHYATYFDRHFLTRSLALYQSLERHSPPFVPWVLCLDDETYRVLSCLRLDHLVLVPLAELERKDPALLPVKESRRAIEYYWTCTAPFLLYLLNEHPRIDLITYLDADMFLFGDPSVIYQDVGEKDILIVEHRWRRFPHLDASHGTYNVGLLAFRRTANSLACLGWWRERCLEWCFYRAEDGRFGDQKYLDEWPTRFERVKIIEHMGVGLAPWNVANYQLSRREGQLFAGSDPVVCFHFHGLKVINRWLYEPGLWRWHSDGRAGVKRHIYVPYARELRRAGDRIRAIGGAVDPVDNVHFGGVKLKTLTPMVRHRSFVLVTGPSASPAMPRTPAASRRSAGTPRRCCCPPRPSSR
jgi:hypothetical protein